MNLFCFSLEGSMDSLYEAVQSSGDGPTPPIPSRSSSHSCSRSSSPALLLDNNTKWQVSRRSISMEIPQMQGTNNDKKKRRTYVSKSASCNEAPAESPNCNTAAWQPAKSQEDLVHIINNHNDETRKPKPRVEAKDRRGAQSCGTRKKEKPPSCQYQSFGVLTESKPAVKSNQKPGKKPVGKSGKEASKKINNCPVHTPKCSMSQIPGHYHLDTPYRSDKRLFLGKSSTLSAEENKTPGQCTEMACRQGGATPTHTQHHHWCNPGDSTSAWGHVQHTCRRPLTEYCMYSKDFATPNCKEDRGHQQRIGQNGTRMVKQDSKSHIPPKVPRSITDVDLSEPNRSTSFGRFEGLRHHSSTVKQEENKTTMLSEERRCLDPDKSSGLGKKMKAISLTMRRKIDKKQNKLLYEETGDAAVTNQDAETDSVPGAEKTIIKANNSLESLYSGQSCSSSVGVTSDSNGCCQRDSLRLEEGSSYQGQFCGRARVHTDFVPSPYDTDSLKLKVGDIIDIISKPPMGIWIGMLKNKVGSFKFIYVDILVEKEEEKEAPKIKQLKLCKRPRPKTLLELLERLNLEEYASTLLLNGYQTVEDLLQLQEKHLIELNVKDPEHRCRLLAAAEYHYTKDDDARQVEEHKCSHSLQTEESDCPRDSGCFIPLECSDGKESSSQMLQTLNVISSQMNTSSD